MIFDSINENKEVFKKYTERWDRIKNQIEAINGGKKGEYDIDFMKIKFDSDDSPLNKPLKVPKMTIVIRSLFGDEGKFYPQIF